MNLILEHVNCVCQAVRESSLCAISFKKLIGSLRTEFKKQNIDLVLKIKKSLNLEKHNFYVLAFYDADTDLNQESPIEIIIYHNFDSNDKFKQLQITEVLIQVFDAVTHELRHRYQSLKRNYKIYSHHESEPYNKYLADPDELDAYALSIAVDLLRAMPTARAKRYMSRMTVLSKMRYGSGLVLVSPNLRSYVSHYKGNPLIKKLAKKVYRHLETLDSSLIFK